jgi:signal transduction histidine kinase
MDFNYNRLKEYSGQIINSYRYKEGELQLLSRKGELIQSSSGFYDQVTYPIDSSVLEYKPVYKIETNKSTKEKVLAYYIPLEFKGQVVGVLRYLTSLDKVSELFQNLLVYGLVISSAVAFIVFLVSLQLGNSIVKPLKEIMVFTGKMAEGKYKSKLQSKYPGELGELAGRLNEMGDEIVKADQLKNDFISSISHELRTPLTGIKGWIETIISPEGLTEEEREFGLNIINKEADRMIGLVENLLDLSRYQSERMELALSAFPVEELIQEVVFQLHKKTEDKLLQVKVDIIPVSILADSDKLKQVLLNILDNAIKFSGREKVIHIIQTVKQKEVVIKIEDEGIGIARQDLAYIMDSFYKTDPKSIGAGLGLAISKKIMDLHKGTIQIDSDYGKGTSVVLTIPIIEPEAQPAEVSE